MFEIFGNNQIAKINVPAVFVVSHNDNNKTFFFSWVFLAFSFCLIVIFLSSEKFPDIFTRIPFIHLSFSGIRGAK